MGLTGMLKTAFLENPSTRGQFIGVDSWNVITIGLLNNNCHEPWETSIQYKNNERYTFKWDTIKAPSNVKELWKTDAVYLITGGLGGLGMLFAEDIVNKTKNPVLILTGRSPLNEEKKNKLQKIEKNGAIIKYQQTDITQEKEVELLISGIVKEFGNLNGIINSAGIIRDNYIIKKTEEELKEVLKVKVDGVVNLDNSSKNLPLDLFISFSSIAGCMGNSEQVDYAAGNAFMDNFSVYRNNLVACQKRSGHTLSVNWPLWKEGGMQVDIVVEKLMKQSMGMSPMKTSSGLESLKIAFMSRESQTLVIEGDEEKIHAYIKKVTEATNINANSDNIDSSLLEEQVIKKLIELVVEVTRLDPSAIMVDDELSDYGFDSILLTKFSNELNLYYDLDIIPTLFYNHTTIKTIACNLIEDYFDKLTMIHKTVAKEEKIGLNIITPTNTSIVRKRSRFMDSQSDSIHERKESTKDSIEGVAIVGISGRFPGSPDLKTFWNNIRDNKDLITEIPEDRWDWKAYYGDSKKENGKTKAKWGGFIEDMDKFDSLFFNISPREAELMDPQQRITLEAVYHALEDSGIRTESIKGSNTGVFVGVASSDYAILLGEQKDLTNQAQFSTGSNHSVLVNRISYLLDLHGPSEPIDTACSSSLVAIHRAVENIRLGHCDMAIAGGVNALLSPEPTLSLSKTGMLSEDGGRCKTFDESANGYVRSEGVGVVILKSLRQAEADGDHIYGVIRGTSQNHGGKANTLTSPNPNAQKEMLLKAYQSANIDPRDVSYIEANGTGTPLGDSIEIEGLKLAFLALYKENNLNIPENPYIGIGSVKTSIGHLETAAGMSGVIKVLLSLEHKTLPGNVHLEIPNKYLKLNNTPFYLQKESQAWSSRDNKPRIAGVSSFGFGGSNAHIIIEEYVAKQKEPYSSNNPAIILLSARNGNRLEAQVSNLLAFLEENGNVNLYDIAYTLQVGRESMEERLSFIVSDLDDLKTQLSNYKEGKREGLFRGNIKKDKNDFLLEGEAGVAYIQTAISKQQIKGLVQLWVRGVVIDWQLLYRGIYPNKISLPTYPFARERYWVPDGKELNLSSTSTAQLHPLLHSNESDFLEQKYQSIYTGRESFLSDHKVKGDKVLPGVAYLELARASGEQSIHKPITQLRDIAWLSPVRVNGSPQEIGISLFEEGNFIGYEVYSGLEDSSVIHSQGKVSTEALASVGGVNIEKLQLSLSKEKEGAECYELFKGLGLDYGSSFRGIDKLYYSAEGSLSKISLPKEAGYVLQPGLLDSALQTCIGLSFSESTPSLNLPFSVKEVNIYGDVSTTVWCYVRKSSNTKLGNKVISYDIDMLSDSGAILLSFKDFVSLPIDGFQKRSTDNPKEELALKLYSNTWQERSIVESDVVLGSTSLILLAGGSVVLADKLQESLGEEVIAVNEDTEIDYYHKIQEIVQSVLKQDIIITVIYRTKDYVDYSFISGLLKTADLESSKVVCKTIGVDSLSLKAVTNLTALIQSEEGVSGKEVRYIDNKREVRSLSLLPSSSKTKSKVNMGVKEGGVYLITGGAGGLGQIFASHISKTKDTKLILTGRSKKSSLSKKKLESLNAVYHSCDITSKDAVAILVQDILTSYDTLDGVIHSAGVIKDNFLIKKTKEESALVLSPKIMGAKYLDLSTKDLDLDFMVYFSSLSGVLGNMGQGDYSSANAWMDSYAKYRNDLVSKGKRKGNTISINWPLWKEGGMQVDAESEKYLEQKTGMVPLPTKEGLIALDSLLKTSLDQGIVSYGYSNRMNESLLNLSEKPMDKIEATELPPSSEIQVEIQERLVICVSEVLKLDKENLELDVHFSDYGVDSILMMSILNAIEASFEIIVEPTTIVNYPTIELLASYIQNEISYASQNQPNKKRLFNVSFKEQILPKVLDNRRAKTRFKSSLKEDKIAIIGMSCCLPGSDTIEEFWDNLKEGKDLISDVPENRWNAFDHYSETKQDNKAYTTKGGFIKNAGMFDAPYFGISDVDAISMDPQQRIILELSRSLFAHAGYKKEEVYNSNTAVYIGAKDNNYVRNNYHLLPEGAHQHSIVNNISNMIAARVSDFYNLKGSSQIIDTACSSSLVAIHQGCEDILQGKTDMAIAGGISIMVDAFNHIGFSQAGVLSKDGKSYVFDEKAQGFVMGEGGGLVLLKSYDQAKIDGDQIYGVISGSSVNNDGKTMGLTVPNIEGQKQAIEQVFSKTDIDPKDITYYEAHGTGTLLGDPIEVKAAKEVYQSLTSEIDKRQYCAIGSVKSNLGHTMTAAGVSGLIKILLQLEHKTLVPTLHCENPHPRFKFEESPFFVNTDLKPWDINGNRKAAISSFGFGGTNCHMIIEEDDSDRPIERQSLPIERLSKNYYWLGKEMAFQDIESAIPKEDITIGSPIHRTYNYNEPIMKDHLILGHQVLMGVAHLSLSIEGTRSVFPNSDFHLEKILFSNPMVLKEGETGVQEFLLLSDEKAVEIHYEIDGVKKLAAKSVISKHDFEHKTIDLESITSKAEKKIKGIDYYNLPGQDFYGESTKTVKDLWYLSNGTVLASLQLNSQYDKETPRFLIHPVILDGAHVAASLSLDKNPEKALENHRPPIMVKRVKVSAKVEICNYSDYYVIIRPKQFNNKVSEFDVELYTDQYELIAVLEGFMTMATSFESLLGDSKNKVVLN